MEKIIFLLSVILLYGAIRWESADIKKIWHAPPVYDITDRKKREKELVWYGTFNYENAITWRFNYISIFISCLLIYIFLTKYSKPEEPFLNTFVIGIIVFTLFYFGSCYRTFHIYRVMASKLKKSLKILEEYK
jgi:hypothetical protein